jgi:hypothetical protein
VSLNNSFLKWTCVIKRKVTILVAHSCTCNSLCRIRMDEMYNDNAYTCHVTTLAMGLRPKQRHGKVRAKSATRESHLHFWECEGVCEGMSPHIPKWIPTLGIGVPMEFLWSPKFLENNFRGQNSLDWKFSYTFEKLLRHRCLKWACMVHLSTENTSYGWEKGWESKCQFDSWPLKVRNHPDLLVCRWHATYFWKSFNKG